MVDKAKTSDNKEEKASTSTSSSPSSNRDNSSTPRHDLPENAEEPDNKRSKTEWLAFHGRRHTRVGKEFQVTALPTPSAAAAPRSADENRIIDNDAGDTETSKNGDDKSDLEANDTEESSVGGSPTEK